LKRLVLDPNTLVSGITAIRSGSPPAQLVRAMQAMRFEVAICPEILREVNKALRKPYFRERVTATEAHRAVVRIEEVAISFDDPSEVPAALRDPKDDYLLALAREAQAEAIVTGDKDLLDHDKELNPPAISAPDACELLELND
jgi:putative PIN family toxin of toxin-antitoxin system